MTAAVAVVLISCTGGNNGNSSKAAADSTASPGGERQRVVDTITIAMTGDVMLGSKYPKPCLPVNEGKENSLSRS